MTKRIVLLLAALGILATSNAFASRGRDIVLGGGDGGGYFLQGGSLFYDSNRNIFYNPAYVNDFKNWASIEKSNYTGVTGVGTNAEGGFVASMGTMALGFYFDRVAAIQNMVSTIPSIAKMRPIEVFAGGDHGVMKGGVSLLYGSSSAPGNTDTVLVLKVGAEIMDFDPFVHFTIIGDDKNTTPGTTRSHKNITVGTRYHWGEWTPYAGWRQDKFDTGAGSDTKGSEFIVGVGRSTKIGEGARLNYALSMVRVGTNTVLTSSGSARTVVPVDLSAEADAASWLSIRAGLTYFLIDKENETTQSDNTTARIGAGVHVGKADFDFAVGKQSSISTNGSLEQNVTTATQVFDIGPGFFSAAGVTYHW